MNARPDPCERFTDRAEDYVRFRPGYPDEAVDALIEGLGPPESIRAVDLGAGTGIFARLLAGRGVGVVALEPNEAMRGAATPHPRVRFRPGRAEDSGLDPSSADLVCAAQSFHWFRAPEALAEAARVLRPAGRLALVWNVRDERHAMTRAYGEAVVEAAAGDPAAGRDECGHVLATAPEFTRFRRFTFSSSQILGLEGLFGRATSASYIPKSGPVLDRLRERLREAFSRHAGADGTVALAYETRVYMADRA